MKIEWDIEELACRALGLSEEATNLHVDGLGVESLLKTNYGIDVETYSEIVQDLLQFTSVWKDPHTGKKYHAFVKDGHPIVSKLIETD